MASSKLILESLALVVVALVWQQVDAVVDLPAKKYVNLRKHE